jgi:hypothetical protein
MVWFRGQGVRVHRVHPEFFGRDERWGPVVGD